MTPEQLFLENRAFIERAARYACRRQHFGKEEIEDFVSELYVKIIEDDYAVIQKYKGGSSFKTYLTTVINNFFLDHLNSLLGKWHTSAEAKRLGPLAIQLERLLVRDRLSLDEACEILRTNHHVEASRQELIDLASKLPYRNPPRRMEGDEPLKNRPSQEKTPFEGIREREKRKRFRQIMKILREELRLLPDEDVLIARMRMEFSVAEIARQLHLDQKPLYRRINKIFKTLRDALERRGIRPDEIEGLFGDSIDDDEPQT